MLAALALASGFLSVQRFALESFNSWVCVLPLLIAGYLFLARQKNAALSFLVVALVCSIDNGAGVYAESPAAVRYSIYLLILMVLLIGVRFTISYNALSWSAVACLLLMIGWSSALLHGVTPFQATAMRRDIFVVGLLVLLLLQKRTIAELDLKLLMLAASGYLVGEFVNILFFYRYDGEYLSYDSLKVFALFPLIYASHSAKSRALFLVLVPMALVVAVFLGSRMIILSSVFFLILALAIHFIARRDYRVMAIMAGAGLGFFALTAVGFFSSEFAAQYRVLGSIGTVLEQLDGVQFAEIFEVLDRGRYGQHVLFFERPIIELLFGSGLGSGLVDSLGVLSYVPIDAQYAFTAEEIAAGVFFNLHDFWIDFGLRFGLAGVGAVFYLVVLRQMRSGRFACGVWFGLLLINTTFATSGLLLMAVMYRFWPKHDVAPPYIGTFAMQKATTIPINPSAGVAQ